MAVSASAFFHPWAAADMTPQLPNIIADVAEPGKHPDGTPYSRISLENTVKIAEQLQLPRRDIEITALAHNVFPERYIRNMHSLSAEDQIKLLQSHVAIVGLGGLGGTVAEALARIGVGTMTLIDGDVFEESNLNRQILSDENNLGCSKADSAAQRIQDINPSITTCPHSKYLDAGNAVDLLTGADVAIDCLDTIAARFLLETASKSLKIPLVSAAVGGFAGQLTTIFPEDKGLELVYGPAQSVFSARGAEIRLGNLAFTVSTLASLEAAEVSHILLRKDSELRNHLLIIDLLDYSFERIRLI